MLAMIASPRLPGSQLHTAPRKRSSFKFLEKPETDPIVRLGTDPQLDLNR
jgi:hypothetical protein